MELLRSAGVAEQVLAASGPQRTLRIRVAKTVRGEVMHEISEDFSDMFTAVERVTPAGWGSASQDQVEPILLAQAEEHGAVVKFGTELTSFEQDDDGVTAQLLDLASGRVETVRARYLIAADGNRSPVRERLGITRSGFGTLANHIGTVFDADLSELLPDDETWLYYLQSAKFTGAFINTNHKNRHIFSVEYHPESGESASDYPVERIAELIRFGLDAPDLKPEIVWRGQWEMAARVADRWRDGRVFLVGDAGKVTPPTGGMGGNAAVCDGFDIAWKLAAVLKGEAGDGLLDTYEPERKRFAQLVVNESLFNYVQRMAPQLAGPDIPAAIGPMNVMMGHRNASTAVIADDDDDSPFENAFEPSGRPGFHAPHVWLEPGKSTVDLVGDWALLTGPDGKAWQEQTDIAGYTVDGEVFGIGPVGASLIRPDGVVAWRTSDEAKPGELQSVLRSVLSC
jgi:aklavinone 12-hydroxylase